MRATFAAAPAKKARLRAQTTGRELVSAWNQRSTTSTGRKSRVMEYTATSCSVLASPACAHQATTATTPSTTGVPAIRITFAAARIRSARSGSFAMSRITTLSVPAAIAVPKRETKAMT